MPSDLQLRPMTEDDLPAAQKLWTATKGVELAEGDSAKELAGYLQRNPGMSFVACAGPHLVGAVLAGHDGRRGLLYHLAVSHEHRGKAWDESWSNARSRPSRPQEWCAALFSFHETTPTASVSGSNKVGKH